MFHPQSAVDISARDALLGSALRPADLPFPIASEYPIVLAPENARFSYCLGEPGNIVAHANLWPRVLVDSANGSRIDVGLVGNVATDAALRGQGLMRQLLDHLKAEARSLGLTALILWSDLLEFYQKQGFTSFGREYRMMFSRESLHRVRAPNLALTLVSPGGITPEQAGALIAGRLPVGLTLERSGAEFVQLLQIPETYLLRAGNPAGGDALHLVVGKGFDMAGVIHEWGCRDPYLMAMGVKAALDALDLPEIMLLAPGNLGPGWMQVLAPLAVSVEQHAMALIWTAKKETADLVAEAFVWGLDSI